jgi:diguanylate cyclase (GGDEF)-like protein/PAS domain S-box-containing protein
MLAATLLIVPIQPAWLPTLVMMPPLVVTVALAQLGRHRLLSLIVVCWLVVVLTAVIAEITNVYSTLPNWLVSTFRISSLAATVATMLLLLWQFSSRQQQMLMQTRAAEERYALAARGANDGLWDWNLQTNELFLSDRWKAMLGYAAHELSEHPNEWWERIYPIDHSRVQTEIAAHLAEHTAHFESEHRILHQDGQYRWVLSRGLAVRDAGGKPVRMVGSLTDITARKQGETQLLHAAFHDSLTGLPNRACLVDHLRKAIQRAKYDSNYQFALLFFDLDRFKLVNDSFGHAVGDELLVALAQRVQTCIREHDTLARLGGDEFTVLLDDIFDGNYAIEVANRIQQILAVPFTLSRYELFTTVSIGIVCSTTNYGQPEELLRDADAALYHAKASGKARHAVFDQAMRTQAISLLQLETDLRRALERQEFELMYQPIVSLDTESITGFEALLRWHHPEHGDISPESFIPVAEETGLIIPIGWWALRTACVQMCSWQRMFATAVPFTISVNVSGRQFIQPKLVENVREIVDASGLAPHRLRLEITESIIVKNTDATMRVLADLHALGIEVYIDDFGTGYSSLSTLHCLQSDALKIDRSFISQLANHGENVEIVQMIAMLAHQLGMDVIVEGIEKQAQLALLQEMGCDYGQGFLFSQPMSSAAVEELLATLESSARGEEYRVVGL